MKEQGDNCYTRGRVHEGDASTEKRYLGGVRNYKSEQGNGDIKLKVDIVRESTILSGTLT